MSYITPPIDSLQTLDRYRFLMLLNAANECEEYQFAKQAAMLWLVNYQGDLYVQYYQALAQINLDNQTQAVPLLEALIEQDPLFIEPVKTLSTLSPSAEQRTFYEAIVKYLRKDGQPAFSDDHWLSPLWKARSAYSQGNFDQANAFIHQSLLWNPPSPLPAILHLQTAHKMENKEMLENLSEIYYQKWSKCLQINIIKAISEIDQGKESAGVERLHYVAAHDSAGQVIIRLMGSQHRFLKLWPDQLEIYFDLPIPASISAYLGWNQLESGEIDQPEFKVGSMTNAIKKQSTQETREIHVAKDSTHILNTSNGDSLGAEETKLSDTHFATEEDLEEIQKAFSKLAKRLKNTDLERSDNRFPVYVIMTSKKQLESLYGPNTFSIVDELLKNLISLIQKLPDWNALLFYPDDPGQMSQLGLKPIIATDAWQVKLSLADLDQTLAKQGEMIGALLIVGGPEIIPFHHLPNPTYDNDLDVPSDNPYATIDENYFIPQWPVGRLPGETGSDSGLLLTQIRQLTYQYQKRSKFAKSGLRNLGSLFSWLLGLIANFGQNISQKQSLGYSAEIWQEASRRVYKTVGNAKDLKLSPPLDATTLILNNGNGHRIGYFNLHGVKDGPNWYGQKDFTSASSAPDYPLALSPTMFNEKSLAPNLIFTEACYGANVLEKHCEEALSLKFVDSGTSTFVGSTCIAYGAVTLPLIAADYLADTFWQKILEGQPAGYALMQAKLNLAEEMTRVQGFLDGEDQKTLLSFVLYGDPLAVHDNLNAMPKPIFRITSPKLRTISDSDMEPYDGSTQMPKDVNTQVKKIVEKYLPGLNNAQMRVNKTISAGDGKAFDNGNSERYIVTLQKSIDQNQHTTHHHFARMTFNKKGKLVKFTTSR